MSELSCNWGQLRGIDADKILSGRPVGSFLVRRSSFADCDVCCWTSKTGTVKHALVSTRQSDGKVHLTNCDPVFDTVEDLVKGYRKTLLAPVPRGGVAQPVKSMGSSSPSNSRPVVSAESTRGSTGVNTADVGDSLTNGETQHPSAAHQPAVLEPAPDSAAFLESLNKKSWYEPIDRVQAERKLASLPTGSFVVRPSSQPRCLSLSHREPSGQVGHVLIFLMASGLRLETESTVHDTIEDLLRSQPLRRDLIAPKSVATAAAAGSRPTGSVAAASRLAAGSLDNNTGDTDKHRRLSTDSLSTDLGSDMVLDSMRSEKSGSVFTDSDKHPGLPSTPLPSVASSCGSSDVGADSVSIASPATSVPLSPRGEQQLPGTTSTTTNAAPLSATPLSLGPKYTRIRSETGEYTLGPPERANRS